MKKLHTARKTSLYTVRGSRPQCPKCLLLFFPIMKKLTPQLQKFVCRKQIIKMHHYNRHFCGHTSKKKKWEGGDA